MRGNVADLCFDTGPAQIDRYDRARNINFEIELNQQPLGEVEKQALALPSLQNLPNGVSQTGVGDAEAMAELFASFGLALFITQTAISMPSVIGLIMLMGIATKNSILLVENAIMARRDKGMTRMEAPLDACHQRARPIIMTTIAMGVGMLPIALGWGVAPSFRSPMATS